MVSFAEYVWMDGTQPTKQLRSKTRVVDLDEFSSNPKDYPVWSYDGSSTYQSAGSFSDLLLIPVRVVRDPFRFSNNHSNNHGNNNVLVLCEVYNPDRTPHKTNTRNILGKVLANGADKQDAVFGFEQEYTLFQNSRPLGWPKDGVPPPQGPYYCGVGPDKMFGRAIIEKHLEYCLIANLSIYGINAEVMPSQWEYQIGYRGFKNDQLDALTICDHQILARWILCRVAEDYNTVVSFDNKPMKGDWNGAGCHTNFSTKAMRDPKNGYDVILKTVALLEKKHEQHINLYGHNLHERLTGEHETCSINEFRHGIADRGASIRIPVQVKEQGYGYLEDRRPGANSDPYVVAASLLTTACNLDWSLLTHEESAGSNKTTCES